MTSRTSRPRTHGRCSSSLGLTQMMSFFIVAKKETTRLVKQGVCARARARVCVYMGGGRGNAVARRHGEAPSAVGARMPVSRWGHLCTLLELMTIGVRVRAVLWAGCAASM